MFEFSACCSRDAKHEPLEVSEGHTRILSRSRKHLVFVSTPASHRSYVSHCKQLVTALYDFFFMSLGFVYFSFNL